MNPSADGAGALLEAAREGDRGALARLLSQVERGGDSARSVVSAAEAMGGSATTVGITGAPGAGKSTLTAALVEVARSAGERVAVLAIDPSSPRTGGAILGDRVRMGQHTLDPDVFIRSMATRGQLGGLAEAAPDAVRLLEAAGFSLIVIETVGVGQVEVDVASTADITVVVVNPRWGDSIQVSKAGLIEVADVFVVNKADRPGADETRRDLEQLFGRSPSGAGEWETHPSGGEREPGVDGRDRRPPVVSTVATTGEGVPELWEILVERQNHLPFGGS